MYPEVAIALILCSSIPLDYTWIVNLLAVFGASSFAFLSYFARKYISTKSICGMISPGSSSITRKGKIIHIVVDGKDVFLPYDRKLATSQIGKDFFLVDSSGKRTKIVPVHGVPIIDLHDLDIERIDEVLRE